jgi:MFS superfamily sulfate permease-like transporter
MSPERLNHDQKLLYECLVDIWNKNTARIMAVCAVFACLVIGVACGVLYGSRAALRQTAYVIRELEERTRLDRDLLLHTSEQQRRADIERSSLIATINRMRRDLEKSQHIDIKKKEK